MRFAIGEASVDIIDDDDDFSLPLSQFLPGTATVNRGLAVAALLCLLAAWSSAAGAADWQACEGKPTRACLLEEALRGDNGPIAGKDRLDLLILTDFRKHLEYLTAADIEEAKRLVTSQPASPAMVRYFSLAARGLVAANRVQEAFDLVSSLSVGMRISAVNEVTAALIDADELDEVPIFGRKMLADPRTVFSEAVKMLAEKGKIEQALAFIALDPAGLPDEEMVVAVGTAYAKRGDPKMAARFYDKAQSMLDEQAAGTVQDDAAMQLRLARISLRALRGDTDGAKAALNELPPASGNPSDRVELARIVGYQKLIGFLLRADHVETALDIAKSGPERYRAFSLLLVAIWYADHDRRDDASAVMALLGDKADPNIRGAFLRALAIATARSGDLTSAVALASQASDPVRRRAILLEVAQTLPP